MQNTINFIKLYKFYEIQVFLKIQNCYWIIIIISSVTNVLFLKFFLILLLFFSHLKIVQ